ncbi:MAG TPA: hypothetical protein VKU00_03570 [Chthonomonadaceae bacterium]|nr:hypothetical protein [Chthonomonadaceae bacterium]
MSKYPEEHETDRHLNQGLRSLPVPEVSADFDARVHEALRRPTPWWQPLWTQMRPVLTAMACSLVITLVLLQGWVGNATTSSHPAVAMVTDARAEQRGREYIAVLDRGMDRLDLSNASWRAFLMFWWPVMEKTQPTPAPAPRRITPDHRSQYPSVPMPPTA